MNKIKLIGILLVALFPLFSWASNGQLSVTFTNRTEGNIEFIPIISGEVEFKTKNIIPPSGTSTDASIVINKVTKRSVIYLRKNGEDIASIILYPIPNDSRQSVVTKIIYPESPNRKETKPKYHIRDILLSFHPECSDDRKCELWSQHPSGSHNSLHIDIETLN